MGAKARSAWPPAPPPALPRPAPPPTSGSVASASSLDGSRPARSRRPRAPAPPGGTGNQAGAGAAGPPRPPPLLTSTSSQWKKWMSGLLCSESWHTSSSMEGYRSWFSTVWLCRTVGSGKFSSSSWGTGGSDAPGPRHTAATPRCDTNTGSQPRVRGGLEPRTQCPGRAL